MRAPHTYFSTEFHGGTRALRARLSNLFAAPRRRGRLPLLGLVPENANVILAASSGQPVAQFTQRGAAQAYGNIARRLLGQTVPLMRIR